MSKSIYISPNGVDDINMLRIGFEAKAVGNPPIELLASLPSDECGCPEEFWRINGVLYMLHFESDGSGELTAFDDEYEPKQIVHKVKDMNQLRVEMFVYHAKLEEMDWDN